MAHKMKYPKGKGFPFKKEEDSPLKHNTSITGHNREYGREHTDEDHPNWDPALDDAWATRPNMDNYDGDTSQYFDDLQDLYDNEGSVFGEGFQDASESDVHREDLLNPTNVNPSRNNPTHWSDKWTSGEPLVKPSITGDEESILTRQAREREESGAHPWARGGQPNPSEVVYPWGDDDGGDEAEDNFVKPNPDYTDQWGNPVSPVGSNEKPTIDTFGNVVSSIDDSPNVDSFGNPASPVNNTRPDPRPETSDVVNARPDTSPVVTDIFGNDVSALNERGRDVPFSTVTTPGTFNLNRTGGSTKGNRGFIQPRNYKKA